MPDGIPEVGRRVEGKVPGCNNSSNQIVMPGRPVEVKLWPFAQTTPTAFLRGLSICIRTGMSRERESSPLEELRWGVGACCSPFLPSTSLLH